MVYHPFFAWFNTGRVRNARMAIGPVKKDPRVFLAEGLLSNPPVPWEQRLDHGYPRVFYDADAQEYRCYYMCFTFDAPSDRYGLEDRAGREYTGYWDPPRKWASLMARSKDGVTWERPHLGVCDYKGSTANNIVLNGIAESSVFRDEHEKDPARRYKMSGRFPPPKPGMAVSYSPDGIHFCDPIPIQWVNEGVEPMADTNNFAFWDQKAGKYALITRTFSDTLRISNRCESDDFIHWTRPVEIYRGDGREDQLYAMPVFVRNGLYLGLGNIFHDGDRADPDFDRMDCELLYSSDGWHFNRAAARQPLIKRGEGNYGSGIPDVGVISASPPVEVDGKTYIYYMGGNGLHTSWRETSLLRAEVDLDKLAGFAPKNDGEALVTTCRIRMTGSSLSIKADIGAKGYVDACIARPPTFHGEVVPLEGFGYDDCRLTARNDGSYEVHFRGVALPKLGNDGFQVCFRFKDSLIYGFGGDIQPVRTGL